MEFTRMTEKNKQERIEYLESLTSIKLEDELIRRYSLDACVNVERIFIGSKVRCIQNYVFAKNHKVREVVLAEDNPNFELDGDCLIDKNSNALVLCFGEPRIPDGVVEADLSGFTRTDTVETFRIGKDFQKFYGIHRSFSIKNIELDPENPYYILEGNCLFERDSDTVVLGCENSVLPERTKRIGFAAFYGCGFERFRFSPNVDVVENTAFENCARLTRLELNEGLKEIGNYAFMHCESLKELSLPDSLQTAGEWAFSSCSALKKVTSYGGLTSLSHAMFNRCGFDRLTVPGKIRAVGTNAFEGCPKLKEVVLENGVEKLDKDAFGYCKALQSVTMANSVKELGEEAFEYCEKLQNIVFSERIEVIPYGCFSHCKSLTEVVLPAGIKRIESCGFYFCSKLERLNWEELKALKKPVKDTFAGCRHLQNPLNVKKPTTIPDAFYAQEDFETMMGYPAGETIEFLRESLSEFSAKFQAGAKCCGAKFLLVKKKDAEFYIEYLDQEPPEDLRDLFDLFPCKTVSENDPRFAEIKAAFEKK